MLPLLLLFFGGCCFLAMCLGIILVLRNRKPGAPADPASPAGNNTANAAVSVNADGFTTTGITFYGQSKDDDNGVGFAGVDLFKHGNAGLQFDGKPLFPAAVFQGDAAGLLWSVLEVRSDEFKNNKTVFVHVVDVCNSGQSVCKTNKAKHGFLVDIHATGFEYVGMNDGVLKGSFRKVGVLKPGSISSNIWLKDGTVACSCTGECKGNGVSWVNHGKCK